MERPAMIREAYINCLNTLKMQHGLAVAGMTGHSRLILEFGLEPEVAKAVTSFWLSTLNEHRHEYSLSGSHK